MDDSDSLLFGLLFNSKKFFGQGHCCSVDWNDNDISDNKINVIKSTFVPKQNINSIKAKEIDLPSLEMKVLYHNS